MTINVYSEIGNLKKVLLHRPGRELLNLMPEYMERLLFDDIPYLKIAQEEHDAFADILRGEGVEVVYLEDLVSEAVAAEDVKDAFLREYLNEAGVRGPRRTALFMEYFRSLSTKNMVLKMIEGFRKSEIDHYGRKNLTDFLEDEYPFLLDPMPNLYFTRDPFASVGHGVTMHRMSTVTRNRESLFAKYVFRHNPHFRDVPLWYQRTQEYPLEGGDILVLSREVVAVGISQRTHPSAIELFAKQLLSDETPFKKVLAFDIPKLRSFMHLDTVFTMVDRDKFTIHPNIREDISLFILTRDQGGKLTIEPAHGSLEDVLKEHLHLDRVTLIKCGGGNVVDAAREQWNDGSNTFAVAPGKVVAYSRNYVTNRMLLDHGIEVLTMPSSELSRGRGGPRCMSMPLVRQDME